MDWGMAFRLRARLGCFSGKQHANANVQQWPPAVYGVKPYLAGTTVAEAQGVCEILEYQTKFPVRANANLL
jgi:hypothetical protein